MDKKNVAKIIGVSVKRVEQLKKNLLLGEDYWYVEDERKCRLCQFSDTAVERMKNRNKRSGRPRKHPVSDAPKPRADAKDLRAQIDALKTTAADTLKNMPTFTPELFRRKFLGIANTGDDVFAVFERVIAALRADGRIGTANCYRDAARSFQAYTDGKMKQHRQSMKQGKPKKTAKNKTLNFADVTPDFLKRYAKAMQDAGNSDTTTAIHCRALRRIYNTAIAEGLAAPELYPFKRASANVGEKYAIATTTANKRALSAAQLAALTDCDNLTAAEQQARDLWLFSMYCNGMNFGDIFRLRRSDVVRAGEIHVVSFYRQKTIRRTRRKQIAVALPPESWQHVEAIITRHGNPDKRPDALLFPTLTDAKSPDAEKRLVQYAIRGTNRHLKTVAAKAGIDVALSTYHARHSFASAMKRSGAPVTFISDALGHTSISTTENYLSGFAPEQAAEYHGKAFSTIQHKTG